jgi:hypothetical protein
MRFDWKKFCDRRHITYVTSGPNTAKGNISIRCPFCGSADKSQHMGLSLTASDPVWGCFRNTRHRGRDPSRLIARLLNITYAAAKSIVEYEGPTTDDFDAAVDRLRNNGQATTAPKKRNEVVMPGLFRRMGTGFYAERFYKYLAARGFDDVPRLVQTYSVYDLRYCIVGPYAWRIIFPIYAAGEGELVGWTGRSIDAKATPRYLTSDNFDKNVLLDFGGITTDDYVIVCEGPFDALKVDYYGPAFGVRAVATLGTAVTPMQTQALRVLRGHVRGMSILFDYDAIAQALDLANELDVSAAILPDGIKDPGEFTGNSAADFLQKYR